MKKCPYLTNQRRRYQDHEPEGKNLGLANPLCEENEKRGTSHSLVSTQYFGGVRSADKEKTQQKRNTFADSRIWKLLSSRKDEELAGKDSDFFRQ